MHPDPHITIIRANAKGLRKKKPIGETRIINILTSSECIPIYYITQYFFKLAIQLGDFSCCTAEIKGKLV